MKYDWADITGHIKTVAFEAATSSVKNVNAESCNFPTVEIWVLTILNLPLNFIEMEGFQPQRLQFLEKNPTIRKFLDRLKFRD